MLKHIQGNILVHNCHSPGKAFRPSDKLGVALFIPEDMHSPGLQTFKIPSGFFAIRAEKFLVFQETSNVMYVVFYELVHAIFRFYIGYISTALVGLSSPASSCLVDDKNIDIRRCLFSGDSSR